MKQNTNIDVKPAGIDKEVLDIMSQEDIISTISDDKQMKRFMLNCFCEFLSQIKDLRKEFDEFMEMISVCSADKLAEFFKELQKNVETEEVALKVQEQIKKGHKKSTKKV